MNGKRLLLIGIFGLISLSGCSMMTVGENQSYCVENGADYSDAGLCADPMKIYENRHKLKGASFQECSNNRGGE